MKRSHTSSLATMHFIVLIFGFTAIIGNLIEMDSILLVWYRMLFAILGLGIFITFKKIDLNIAKKDIAGLIGIGLIVAAHWVTFFQAIKISNISVTLGVVSSGTLFASIIEPILFKKKIKGIEIIIGFFIVFGLYLIFQYELNYIEGIIVALVSTFLGTLFTILNKAFIARYNTSTISFYEMVGGVLGLTVFLISTNEFNSSIFSHTPLDFVYTAILGLVCTAFAFAVSIDVMKELSAFTVILSLNMEPIYGIVLAFFIFGESEMMTGGFYLGTIIILLSLFVYPIILKRTNTASR